MRLYLALAVLMLAFVAYTDAQDSDIKQSFASFTERVNEFSRDLAERVKNTFEGLQHSEFATTSSNWLRERFDIIQTSLKEMTQ
ncbi:hypothetical protein INR49_001556 [Caranx melampygus]|nr:hypothetical protein INR49_001556 [Caranx melampygus]